MKISKLLSWIGQLFAQLFAAIFTAKSDITTVINEQSKANTEGFSTVKNEVAQSQTVVTDAVAAKATASIEAINEHANKTADSVTQYVAKRSDEINEKLDAIQATESEDDLRRALEEVLPREVVEQMKW